MVHFTTWVITCSYETFMPKNKILQLPWTIHMPMIGFHNLVQKSLGCSFTIDDITPLWLSAHVGSITKLQTIDSIPVFSSISPFSSYLYGLIIASVWDITMLLSIYVFHYSLIILPRKWIHYAFPWCSTLNPMDFLQQFSMTSISYSHQKLQGHSISQGMFFTWW